MVGGLINGRRNANPPIIHTIMNKVLSILSAQNQRSVIVTVYLWLSGFILFGVAVGLLMFATTFLVIAAVSDAPILPTDFVCYYLGLASFYVGWLFMFVHDKKE